MDAAAAAQPVPWPDAPTQVTDLETAANVLSMQERAVRSILRDINDGGDETQEKYAGDDTSQSFMRWERALLQTADLLTKPLSATQIAHLRHLLRHRAWGGGRVSASQKRSSSANTHDTQEHPTKRQRR